MLKPISVYDGHSGKRLAFLQNAYAIKYELHTNALWTGSFTLPYSDPKNKYCKAFNHVELWDQDAGGKPRYIGLFRIMPQTQKTIGNDRNIVYNLEHVLSTLLDDTIHGFKEIGNKGVYTNQVLGFILDQQLQRRWVLGDCDYKHQYLYGWQDENLLSALFSVVQPFTETDYYWHFDTRKTPWILSLKQTNKKPMADIRYKKNLSGLTRIVDPTNLTTRLYCYGYGQGDNKLTIAEHNNGLKYIDSPNINKYGIITQIWTDERFTVSKSLFDVGSAMLKKLEEPKVTYEMDIQTLYSAGDLTIGDTVRVVSQGLDELMVVKNLSKDDVSGQPMSGKVELGAGTIDISDSLAQLADKQRISETYSQGSESIFMDSFVDNADPQNPAEVSFIIPENAVHVNEIRFSCNLESFRAYSRAILGGGRDVVTTDEGGTEVESTEFAAPFLSTTEATTPPTVTSMSGGGVHASTQGGGGVYASTESGASEISTYGITYGTVGNDGAHNHGIEGGTKLAVAGGGYVWWAPSGGHSHSIALRGHTHAIHIGDHSHYFDIPQHDHFIPSLPHSHAIDSSSLRHKHSIHIPKHSHSLTIPNHTHDIEYGIYKGPSAANIKVYLDDTHIGDYKDGIKDVNLISYMSKNANGEIMRGRHTIKIVPDALTRVECHFQVRLFTNALGGKQY